jgi:hypothetical protein
MTKSAYFWKPPPDRRSLGFDEAQGCSVCLERASDEAQCVVGCLTLIRWSKRRVLNFQPGRRRFVVRWVAHRSIRGGSLDIDPARVMFSRSPQGGPLLGAGCGAGSLGLNLSYTGRCALADRARGAGCPVLAQPTEERRVHAIGERRRHRP